jgi:hypothetical protein
MRSISITLFWLLLSILKPTQSLFHKIEQPDEKFGQAKGLRSYPSPKYVGDCIKIAPPPGQAAKMHEKRACTPDFMFIGASKAGSSSLAYYIRQHPMVRNMIKWDIGQESHLWDRTERNRGFEYTPEVLKNVLDSAVTASPGWDPSFEDKRHGLRPLVMEYTPNYVASDDVPAIIKKALPHSDKLRFIMVLREPTKRTISSWLAKKIKHSKKQMALEVTELNETLSVGMIQSMCISHCVNSLSLDRPLSDCSFKNCRRRNDNSLGTNGGLLALAHVAKSLYVYQLMVWFSLFPRENFYILTLEAFAKNPVGELEKILDFLGLPLYDPQGKFEFGWPNRSAVLNELQWLKNWSPKGTRFEQDVTPAVKKSLNDFFEPHNRLLDELLAGNPPTSYSKGKTKSHTERSEDGLRVRDINQGIKDRAWALKAKKSPYLSPHRVMKTHYAKPSPNIMGHEYRRDGVSAISKMAGAGKSSHSHSNSARSSTPGKSTNLKSGAGKSSHSHGNSVRSSTPGKSTNPKSGDFRIDWKPHKQEREGGEGLLNEE